MLSSKNCELAREVKNQDEIDKNEKEKNRKLESIVSLKNEYGNLLDLTLPPKEFTDIHNQTLNLFKNIYNSSQTIKYSSCIEFYKTISILDKKLENRKELHKIADKITLTYQPPIIPLSINSEKDLNFNISFKSPIGNFSLARSSDEGIKKLIIISQNKRRYFSLDRPFEFYIPKNNGVSVSLQDEVLTINVFDK